MAGAVFMYTLIRRITPVVPPGACTDLRQDLPEAGSAG